MISGQRGGGETRGGSSLSIAFSIISVEETSSGGPEPYLQDQKREMQPQEQGLRRYRRMTNDGIDVRSRQDPLRKHYRESPDEAMITDRAITSGGANMDPFHGKVVPGSEDHGVVWPFGIQPGVPRRQPLRSSATHRIPRDLRHWGAHRSAQQFNVYMRVSFPGSGQEMTESPHGEGFAQLDVPAGTACVACHPWSRDFSEKGNDQGKGEI